MVGNTLAFVLVDLAAVHILAVVVAVLVAGENLAGVVEAHYQRAVAVNTLVTVALTRD